MYLRSATTLLCFYLFGHSSARLHNIANDAITLTSDQPQSDDLAYYPMNSSPAHWPLKLIKPDTAVKYDLRDGIDFLPTNTDDANSKDWVKNDVPCDPLLGEAWSYKGEHTMKYSASVYFTPEIIYEGLIFSTAVAGVISAIEADYYGYVEENLIGKYFSEEKTSKKDGPYRSISVALRNGKEENLCDQKNPVTPGNAPYIQVSPGMANVTVPVVKDSPELEKKFKEGSCITRMGNHWARDIVGGNVLSYKTENFFPIVPMYSTTDNTINGIFFTATSKKQTDPPSNMWDGANLRQENKGKHFMCANFCDSKCHFTGTSDGFFTTMHWFFKNTSVGENKETCQGEKTIPFCKNGVYPSHH